MKISVEDYYSFRSSYDGYCEDCDDITRWGSTEPDVVPEYDGYTCPDCGGGNIWGVEMAMCVEKLEIIEEV